MTSNKKLRPEVRETGTASLSDEQKTPKPAQIPPVEETVKKKQQAAE